MTSALPLKVLKIICVCTQPCLHSWNPGHQVLGECPSPAIFCACCHTSLPGKVKLLRNNWEFRVGKPPGLCPMYLFPWLILIGTLYSFTVINHNHDYSNSQWVLVNYWNWGWSWEPLNPAVGVRSVGGLLYYTLQLHRWIFCFIQTIFSLSNNTIHFFKYVSARNIILGMVPWMPLKLWHNL